MTTTNDNGARAARGEAMQTQMKVNVDEIDESLLAAAPELLVALVDLVGLVATKHPRRSEWTQAARDAIARAKGEPIMRGCSECGDEHDVDDLTSDGQCERCVAACVCATCGADVEPDGDDGRLCGDCADEQAAEDDGHCSTCGGHGGTDEHGCRSCAGRGHYARPSRDPDRDRVYREDR